jgi:ATP-dependent Clp protease ATP-binding subunit ClpA
LLHGAFDEALRLRHSFVAEDHFLLALVRPSEETMAAQVLRESGVNYEALSAFVIEDFARSDPPLEEADLDSGICTNPAAHELMGRAEGLAAGLGAGQVSAEHVLLALLWSPGTDWMFEGCGTTRQAV